MKYANGVRLLIRFSVPVWIWGILATILWLPSALAEENSLQLKQFLQQAALQLDKPKLDPSSLAPLEQTLEELLNTIQKRKRQTTPSVQHFLNKVKPILQQKCFTCHSPKLSMAELDLTTQENLLQGGSRGPAIIPGQPEESLLVQLITHQREPKMPKGEDQLSETDIEAIKTWIQQGALYDVIATKKESEKNQSEPSKKQYEVEVSTGIERPELKEAHLNFWSFQPLERYDVPDAIQSDWAQTPIDAFVLNRMEANGVQPAPKADKTTLIRRLYFDLIGLPPSPEQVDAFLQDDSPDAYKTLVNDLLSSKHFGERWSRHWLDVARYADSGGYEFDVVRPNAFPYRDFVIKAFNQDLPFHQFLKWQLAGDEYEPNNPMALAATGFCTSGPTISNQEAEINRYDELDDMVSTTSQAMLGLTVACARCHDHKFDPISQYDYYRLTAFFTSSKRTVRELAPKEAIEEHDELANEHKEKLKQAQAKLRTFEEKHLQPIRMAKIDALPITVEEKVLLKLPRYKDVKEQQKLLKQFEKELEISQEEIEASLSDYDLETYRYLKKQVTFLQDNPPKPLPKGLTLTDKDVDPVLSYFLGRGDPANKIALVEPGFLSVLTPPELDENPPRFVDKPKTAKTTFRRTALAEWITDAEQGAGALSARVYTNRIWMHLMGKGLVATPNDFGFQGERPTHPKLLDWLATELLQNNGSTKHLIRLIVTSSVYQQSANPNESALVLDPENKLWTRRPLKRLEAEVQRDAILAISGSLNPKMYGPGVKPYMHPDAIATGSTDKWPQGVVDGPETWRRSVYMFIRRSVLHPLMSLFDAPDATSSCARRVETIVPTQALTFLNDKFMREQSALFAQRILDECGSEDLETCIERVFRLALSRKPVPEEIDLAKEFIQEQQSLYQSQQESGSNDKSESTNDETKSSMKLALTDFCQSVTNLNEFVYIQ